MAQASQSNSSNSALRQNLLNRLYGDSDYNKIDQNEYNAINDMDTKKMMMSAHNKYIKNIISQKYGNSSNSQQMIDYQMDRLGQKDMNEAPDIDSSMMPDYTQGVKDLSQSGSFKAGVEQFVNDEDGLTYFDTKNYNQNGLVPKRTQLQGGIMNFILSKLRGE